MLTLLIDCARSRQGGNKNVDKHTPIYGRLALRGINHAMPNDDAADITLEGTKRDARKRKRKYMAIAATPESIQRWKRAAALAAKEDPDITYSSWIRRRLN